MKLLSSWKRSLFLMNTSSAGNYTLTLISTVDSSTEQWDSQLTCTPFSSQFPELWAGSLIGLNFWLTLRTTFTDLVRTTRDLPGDNLLNYLPGRMASSRLMQLAQRSRSEGLPLRRRPNDCVLRIIHQISS